MEQTADAGQCVLLRDHQLDSDTSVLFLMWGCSLGHASFGVDRWHYVPRNPFFLLLSFVKTELSPFSNLNTCVFAWII